ncbi:hypothetical protein OCF84_21480 (plasmid) [Shewanella xiamenensis]|uniref:Uncharacterized protein n=1 Tax=Shewanella xiamenensis TaxID=332186 RepID=A0ABT6UDJ9_9GAMM|nr:hypothetical protein [Shewanella xiamenensis]MDI5832551.1 hypothetical protein [Shewanella xiamenensis]WHF57831.1 hypothetical protein OCF84_21480 [Shewanella xiamenensis]
MAVPFIVLDGKLDKATRLRLAITKGTAIDEFARLITIEDIKRQWEFLSDSGLSPHRILELANGDGSNISDAQFTKIMKSLNSYL